VDWTVASSAREGDIGLFYFSRSIQAVMAIGIIAEPPRRKPGDFPWTKRNSAHFAKFRPLIRLKNQMPLRDASTNPAYRRWYKSSPYRNTRLISDRQIAGELFDAILAKNPDLQRRLGDAGANPTSITRSVEPENIGFSEGGIQEIVAEIRKRDPRLKRRLREDRGTTCEICEFSFGDRYGP